MEKIVKGIKLRLYPTKAQQDQFWQMFGNDRFVWNQMFTMASNGSPCHVLDRLDNCCFMNRPEANN